MTVQVDSQPVTDQITWYIDMCCNNNTISCLEKKTTVRNTLSDMLILRFYCHKRYTLSEPQASSENPHLLRCWRSSFTPIFTSMLFQTECVHYIIFGGFSGLAGSI